MPRPRTQRSFLVCSAAASAATFVGTAPNAAAETPSGDLVRYDGKDPIPLRLDAARIAIASDGDVESPLRRLADEGLIDGAADELVGTAWALADTLPGQNRVEDLRELVALAAADPEVDFAAPVFFDDAGLPAIPTPTLLVRFDSDTTTDAALAAIGTLGQPFEIEAIDWAGMSNAFKISRPTDGFEVIAAANTLARRDDVEWAEVDWLLHGTYDLVPNDPGFPGSWHLLNTGQTYNLSCLGISTPDGIAGQDLGASAAWDVTTGDPSVLVAIFDDGIDLAHLDINSTPGFDLTSDGPGDGSPQNATDTHGTAVGGVVASRINNGIGAVGVAPDAVVIPMRISISQGASTGLFMPSWIIEGLQAAVDVGALVTNHSYSLSQNNAALSAKFSETDELMAHFAAAGNDGESSLSYPSSLPTVRSVAALDPDGTITGFSNYGDGIFAAAPGSGVFTSYPGDASGWFCGTSAASPCAAGVAALLFSANPALPPQQVIDAMALSAVDVGQPGYDDVYGWGFLNAYGALLEVFGSCAGAGQGDCYAANGSPGCDQEECCLLVCTEDPFCCAVNWDGICANIAVSVCLGCPSPGDCFIPHGGQGCDDESCCFEVCEIDPLCCDADFGWDASCVGIANQNCGGQGCGSGESCFVVHSEPGCSDEVCCLLVCAQDSLCCDPDFSWDPVCVELALDLCAGPIDNDDCADAELYAQDVVFFSTEGATPDGPSHSNANCSFPAPFYSDVWYDFVPECTGVVSLTAHSPGNTMLMMLYNTTSCSVTDENILVCTNGTGTINMLSLVVGGVPYKLRLATPNPSPASGTIAAQCAVFFDNCSQAWNIGSFEGTLGLATLGANTDGPVHASCAAGGNDQIFHDVWFDWQAPCTGNLVVSTCGIADFDTRIAIYNGTNCPVSNASLIECFDDHPTCPGGTTLAPVPVQQGQWYKVRVGSASPDQTPGLAGGEVSFLCSPGPSNDFCQNAAFTILGAPTPFCTTNAQTDGPAHAGCGTGVQIVQDVWFRRTATCSGTMTVSTCGDADYLVKLAAYDDCGQCPPGPPLACSNSSSACPGFTDMSFDVVEGQCYLIRVGGVNDSGCGALTFSCSSACEAADQNGDGLVDVQDLVDVILGWGQCPGQPGCTGDVNGDGNVDVQDLIEVIVLWGPCP